MCNLSGYVEEVGRKQGIEQGKNQERQSVIENMLKKNYPDSEIMEITGITKETLQEIKEQCMTTI